MYKAIFRDGNGALHDQLIDMSPCIPFITSQMELWSECGKFAALMAHEKQMELVKIVKE